MNYYFAYGSNLDEAQMKMRCPDAEVVGLGVLKNYALEFNIFSPRLLCGCADIVPQNNSEVWGLIYTLSETDFVSLDIYEGVERGAYKRISVDVTDTHGSAIKCIAYDVVTKTPNQIPSKDYLSKITNAADRYPFSAEYRQFLQTIPTLDTH